MGASVSMIAARLEAVMPDVVISFSPPYLDQKTEVNSELRVLTYIVYSPAEPLFRVGTSTWTETRLGNDSLESHVLKTSEQITFLGHSVLMGTGSSSSLGLEWLVLSLLGRVLVNAEAKRWHQLVNDRENNARRDFLFPFPFT